MDHPGRAWTALARTGNAAAGKPRFIRALVAQKRPYIYPWPERMYEPKARTRTRGELTLPAGGEQRCRRVKRLALPLPRYSAIPNRRKPTRRRPPATSPSGRRAERRSSAWRSVRRPMPFDPVWATLAAGLGGSLLTGAAGVGIAAVTARSSRRGARNEAHIRGSSRPQPRSLRRHGRFITPWPCGPAYAKAPTSSSTFAKRWILLNSMASCGKTLSRSPKPGRRSGLWELKRQSGPRTNSYSAAANCWDPRRLPGGENEIDALLSRREVDCGATQSMGAIPAGARSFTPCARGDCASRTWLRNG